MGFVKYENIFSENSFCKILRGYERFFSNFRIDYKLIDILRHFFLRDCCPVNLRFKSRGGNTAKLWSVSIADLWLLTEVKIYEIDSFFGIQI